MSSDQRSGRNGRGTKRAAVGGSIILIFIEQQSVVVLLESLHAWKQQGMEWMHVPLQHTLYAEKPSTPTAFQSHGSGGWAGLDWPGSGLNGRIFRPTAPNLLDFFPPMQGKN
ncbi:hypothetical protein ACO22_06552 [Paracoccidioides brasiliensis]|uniref:Uncharacterized protein n=1 Tax=Paracoccidioides brasiliensis TaxID=121759 RepID=A0A1D2J757_PARBR|nr:hypothetical protein ACO22_06552 [Paracoccidioides brasiliensis]